MRTIEYDRGRRGARVAALVLAGLLVSTTAACGARWTEEQQAQVLSRDRGGRGASSGTVAAAGPKAGQTPSAGPSAGKPGTGTGPTATNPNGVSSPTSGPGSGGGPTSGPTTPVAGPVSGPATDPAAAPDEAPTAGPATDPAADPAAGPQGPGAVAGPTGSNAALPCTAPSKEKGVTDSQLTIATISTLSGPVPGLGSSAAAGAQAYVAERNATGGVCGRELVWKSADDGADASRYRSVLQELNPDVLGVTGGMAVGDLGAEDVINDLQIPIVGAPTGRTGELRWVFDMVPPYPQPDMLVGHYRYLHEQGARKVSMTYLAVEQSRTEANIQKGLMESAGLEIVHTNELPLSTLSYDSAARAAANSGADYMWVTADTNGAASMARAVYDTGHDWPFKEFSYTTYGTNFVEQAGPEAAEGVTSWIRSLPTEEASSNPVMASFVEWMDRVGPGLPQDLFAIDSYAATKAFVEAIERVPGPITREAVVQQLEATKTFDAQGMFAPISLGQELSQGCMVGMIVRDGAWQRLAPDGGGFIC